MREKKDKKRILVFAIMLLILFLPFSSAAEVYGYSSSSSNAQYYQPNVFNSYSQQNAYTYWPSLQQSDKCEATVDFMMFVRPGGCSPDVVRSDLLEEQNVPVFCKVDIIKLNPLVDVSNIRSVKFDEEKNPYVVDVSFHPDMEAIKLAKGLDKPLINDAGYVVILLKSMPEAQMPESVKVNITGVLRFSMENVFGAGKNNYYLEVDNNYWVERDNYKENSFWKGKGYLRADWVDGIRAGISIYRDKDEKLVSFDLEEGKISNVYYMPGFYCRAGLQVKLEDVKAVEERVELEVDGNKEWLVEGERFLDNECQVLRINVGDAKKVTASGEEREKSVKINCKGKVQDLSYTEEKKNDGWIPKEAKEEDVQDKAISEGEKTNFNRAKEYVNQITKEYKTASEGSGEFKTIWGAQALFELAKLAEKIGLKKDARDLFLQLIEEYSDTSYSESAKEELNKIYSELDIDLGYNEHYIRLLSIKTPTKEEASADFVVWKVGNNQIEQTSRQEEKEKQEKEEFGINEDKKFKLIKLEKDKEGNKAILEYKGKSFGVKQGENKYLPENCEEDRTDKNECEYKIYFENAKIKEIAKVSLISKIPNEYSESNFGVEIGIEKRAIQLSPEKTAEMIDNLDKSIKKFESTLETLGNVVKGWKAACYATSFYLLAKNFIQNLGGGATARQKIMPLYYDKCRGEAVGDEGKFNACLIRESANIEKDMKAYQGIIEPLNDKIVDIQNQKENKDKAGYVNREKVVAELRKEYSSAFSLDLGENTDAKLSKMSFEQARDLIEANQILSPGSGATDALKADAEKKKENIVNNLKGTSTAPTGGIYEGDDDSWFEKSKVVYYSRGKGEKKVEVVPIPRTYKDKDGKDKKGFYVYVPDSAYDASGNFNYFYINNIGKDNLLDKDGDDGTLVDVGDWKQANIPVIFELDEKGASPTNTRQIMRDAEQAIRTANDNYGKRSFRLFDGVVSIDVKETVAGEKRCVDYMSPTDCATLFNVCDPVLCPSSRCDLGGNYRVDNVVASGIIGSIALCLPNFGSYSEGKVLVPVCLSGIHAGLENFLTIMKAHRDCLKEKLETGKYVGFCDEVYSLYLCDFFWRQSGMFLDVLMSNFIGSVHGAAMKGGGEYLTVQDSWNNLENTIDFMKNDYAVNAVNAFQARTTGEIGTEFCKMFVSARYPNNKDFFNNLLEPESPIQFNAWFDEMPYSTATVPATSQYKVYYHIFAGNDQGVSYQVYLAIPQESAYVSVQERFIVATNFIPRGGYYTEAKDFTAPSGYKKLCVRINGKDECGFGKVSSGFALNYLTDKYYEEQAKEKVTTEKECISGTPSAYSLLQPNIQAGVEEVISPELEQKGIVRICSTQKPDISTNPGRWKDVGYCDNEKMRCWLDMNSVKDVIQAKNIEKEVTGDVSGKELANQVGIPGEVSVEDANKIIGEAKEYINAINDEFRKLSPEEKKNFIRVLLEDKGGGLKDRIDGLQNVRKGVQGNNKKAEAGYYQFKIYATIVDMLWGAREKETGEAQETDCEKQGGRCYPYICPRGATGINFKCPENKVCCEGAWEEETVPPIIIPTQEAKAEGECKITDAYWAFTQDNQRNYLKIVSAKEGTEVYMVVKGKNCEGKSAIFTIYEDDFIRNDLVKRINTRDTRNIFSLEILIEKWKTEYIDDGIGNPEFFFKVLVHDEKGGSLKSDSLKVIKKVESKEVAEEEKGEVAEEEKGEVAEEEKGEVAEEGEIKEIVFEFEEGGTFSMRQNLFYRFAGQKWQWTTNVEDWKDVNNIPSSWWNNIWWTEENQNFIKSLQGVSYDQGLDKFEERIKNAGKGSLVMEGQDIKFIYEKDNQCRMGCYRVQFTEGKTIWYLYTNDKWYWTYDKRNFMTAEETVLYEESLKDPALDIENIKLIEELASLDKNKGRRLIIQFPNTK